MAYRVEHCLLCTVQHPAWEWIAATVQASWQSAEFMLELEARLPPSLLALPRRLLHGHIAHLSISTMLCKSQIWARILAAEQDAISCMHILTVPGCTWLSLTLIRPIWQSLSYSTLSKICIQHLYISSGLGVFWYVFSWCLCVFINFCVFFLWMFMNFHELSLIVFDFRELLLLIFNT